jgi:transcriptional regulator with XRE-family HTH domain
VNTNSSSSARKARQALGLRLRELRLDAGLTGRELAAATAQHFTRVSKIENGAKAPSQRDIRAWCAACAAEDQVADLIAQARAVESMYLEHRRQTRSGMKRLMNSVVPLYERTDRFRIYEHNIIPGLFQTPDYSRAIVTYWTEFLGAPEDIDEAVAVRQERQTVLHTNGKTFAVVLEEAALRTWFGTAEMMAEQCRRLLSVAALPNVSLGVVPTMIERRAAGPVGFWIFDDKLVALETPTASIEVTQPQEIALYERMFDDIRPSALLGRDARALITAILSEIERDN